MSSYVLRYGILRSIGVFSARGESRFGRGAQVVARTNRGLEVGEVLAEATEDAVQRLANAPGGSIFRELSTEDANELAHIQGREREEFEICEGHVVRLGLPMQLVELEHLFGGERVIVYYLSED